MPAGTATKPKTKPNYGKLAADSEIRRDGFKARADRAMAEITRLLKDFPERVKIAEAVTSYGRASFDLHNEQAQLDRYRELEAKSSS